MKLYKILLFILLLPFLGCYGSGPGNNSSDKKVVAPATDMDKISQANYNALSAEEKYRISNKLVSTLFKGVGVSSFFDLSGGVFPLKLKDGEDYIEKIASLLSERLTNKSTYLDRVDNKYTFDDQEKAKEYPLAMLFELPLSKDYYDNWMAYILANTILFSPAEELETVSLLDIQKVYYRLTHMIEEDRSIRTIVYEHMITQENWRRFRSPEDNTREMMEIFLGRFIDEEVPLSSKACQNWSISDGNQGYQLIIGFNENSEPQEILDTTLTSCYEFYRTVSEHTSLIPTLTKILVDRFFVVHTREQKIEIVNQIVASNPTTFRQLFSKIIFSKSYLLKNNRPKWYEETFFNVAHRINWYGHETFFRNLISRPSATVFTLEQMKQDSMSYKLGRLFLPLDSLSFAYYHKSVREQLFLDQKTQPFNQNDGGWQARFIDVDLIGDDFIHYLFLSVLSRSASDEELAMINEVIIDMEFDNDIEDKEEQTRIVLDYFSRLSELYIFKEI